MIKVGIVERSLDDTQSGTLSITPLTPEGSPGLDTFNAGMASPCLGGGEGIFTIPGPMSKVLYADVNDLGLEDIPHKYIWFAAIAAPNVQAAGRFTCANAKDDPEDWDNTEEDHLSRPPGKDQIIVDAGNPEAGNAYADNNLPQQQIFKYRGHKLVLSKKVTEQGRANDSLLLQARDGKRLHVDSGPAELHMDRITMRDENHNSIAIRTGGKQPDSILVHSERDQEQVSINGAQHSIIMKGAGDQIRDNKGTGNIEDNAYQGSHNILAEKDISRICVKGDITHEAQLGSINLTATQGIVITCGASQITITPASIDITSPIITVNGMMTLAPVENITGESLLNAHQHMDGFIPGFTTSLPQN